MRWLRILLRKWGRRQQIERIVHEALRVFEAERRRQFAELAKQIRELRMAYIERYDEEEGTGLPARQARLEARLEGLAADIVDLVRSSAGLEVMLSQGGRAGDRDRDNARQKYRRELIASNPGLAPYDDE